MIIEEARVGQMVEVVRVSGFINNIAVDVGDWFSEGDLYYIGLIAKHSLLKEQVYSDVVGYLLEGYAMRFLPAEWVKIVKNEVSKETRCVCDINSLMTYGCGCGAIEKELAA